MAFEPVLAMPSQSGSGLWARVLALWMFGKKSTMEFIWTADGLRSICSVFNPGVIPVAELEEFPGLVSTPDRQTIEILRAFARSFSFTPGSPV